jgi:hypothetical protein
MVFSNPYKRAARSIPEFDTFFTKVRKRVRVEKEGVEKILAIGLICTDIFFHGK